MELFDKDVKVTKTVLYPPPKKIRSSRKCIRGINKFGLLLSDYDSYEDYSKALHKLTSKFHRSLPINKAKRNLSRRTPENREKRRLYNKKWRARNPEYMALANTKDKLRRRQQTQLRKVIKIIKWRTI